MESMWSLKAVFAPSVEIPIATHVGDSTKFSIASMSILPHLVALDFTNLSTSLLFGLLQQLWGKDDYFSTSFSISKTPQLGRRAHFQPPNLQHPLEIFLSPFSTQACHKSYSSIYSSYSMKLQELAHPFSVFGVQHSCLWTIPLERMCNFEGGSLAFVAVSIIFLEDLVTYSLHALWNRIYKQPKIHLVMAGTLDSPVILSFVYCSK